MQSVYFKNMFTEKNPKVNVDLLVKKIRFITIQFAKTNIAMRLLRDEMNH